jgi:hypothetical protein
MNDNPVEDSWAASINRFDCRRLLDAIAAIRAG